MSIKEKWDNLDIRGRVDVAVKAKRSGRIGSASWANLHPLDQKALIDFYDQKETKPEIEPEKNPWKCEFCHLWHKGEPRDKHQPVKPSGMLEDYPNLASKANGAPVVPEVAKTTDEVITISGRRLIAPKIRITSKAMTTKDSRKADKWLLNEAKEEIGSKLTPTDRISFPGSPEAKLEFQKGLLEGINPKKMTQADKDTAWEILTGNSDAPSVFELVGGKIITGPSPAATATEDARLDKEIEATKEAEIQKAAQELGDGKPCHICHSMKWWQRSDGTWVCGKCHPNPNEDSRLEADDSRLVSGEVDEKILQIIRPDLTSSTQVDKAIPKPVKPQDYIQWVGWSNYPTIKSFVAEAERLGVSKRISKIPSGLVLGKSRIFLAHDEGQRGDATIFGYYIPDIIEMIVYDGDSTIPKDLRGKVIPISVEEASLEPERGCGKREDVGAMYLRSTTEASELPLIEGNTDMIGVLKVLSPMKDYNSIIDPKARRFRGIKKINGDKILSGKTKSAPSLRYKVKSSQKIKRSYGDNWTKEERDVLWDLTQKMPQRMAFREMSKINGRSLPAMDYQYRQMMKVAKKSGIKIQE